MGTKEELGRSELEADRVNWLVEGVPARFACTAQIRYQHEPATCTVERRDNDCMLVAFHEPQIGVTPGQAVVLYRDEQVLGGGWICR